MNFIQESTKKDPIFFSENYIEKIDSSYVVGPGDYFEIIMNGTSTPYQVGAEGTITISGISSIKVDSLPLNQVKKLLLEQLSQNFPNSQTVIHLFKTRKINVVMLGYVNKPSSYKVNNMSSILELIHMAQGLEKDADLQNAMLIRNSDTTIVNLKKLLKEGAFSENIVLQDGDRVYVPKIQLGDSIIYYIKNGDYFPLDLKTPAKSLYYYIDNLEFLQTGNVRSLIIKNQQGIREYTHEQAKKVFPVVGDTIDTRHSYTDVFVGGMVKTSGPQKFNPDARPIEYIYNAGTSVMADQLDRVRVIRMNGTFEYIDPINGEVFPGDYIELDMSGLDYAVKWTPIFSAILSFTTIVWSIYYNTVWVPNNQ